MFDIDIELGQTDIPKSEHETEADRVEKSLRRWIMSKSESGKNIEKIFNEASEQGPTILVIDERNDSHQSEVSGQVKDLVLTLTEGFESLPGIFVIVIVSWFVFINST